MTLGSLSTDLRLAARALARRPVFTLSAVLTLALGLGAAVAIFSVADAVLLRPLPYPQADRLVRVLADNPEIDVFGAGVAAGDLQDFRRHSRTLAALAGYTVSEADLTGRGPAEVVRAARVGPDLFPILGAEAALGRTFRRGEEVAPLDRVVILSHSFWRSRFGGGQAAIGRHLSLDGLQHEVVGVMPPGFAFPNPETQVWLPLALPPAGADRMSHYLGTIGRLAPEAGAVQAQAELARLAAELAAEHPGSNAGWTVRVVRTASAVSEGVRPAVLVLSAAVALLLLIACANVAGLLLVHGASRAREAAIRTALGAPRLRMARSLWLESLLLALAGGALGVLLAFLAVETLGGLQLPGFPRYRAVAVDGRALLVALLLVVVTGLAAGLSPALRLSRPDVGGLIKSTHGTGGRDAARSRGIVVVLEVALALMLLVAAGLMLQSFRELGRVDPGFDPRGVLVQRVSLSPERYPDVPRQVALFESLLDGLRADPRVTAAAAVSAVPLHPAGQNLLPFQVPGTGSGGAGTTFAVFSSVTPGSFRTLGVRLREGRDFGRRDDAGAPPVMIVDETLARRWWPRESAVGKRLAAAVLGGGPVVHEIVGVVGAVRSRELAADPEPAIYVPYRQVPPRSMAVIARTRGDALALAAPVQRLLAEVDPDQPVHATTTLSAVVAGAGSQAGLYTWLLGAFAVVGLLLSAVGIYGVVAYGFAQRRHEMAIRAALGARSSALVGLVVGAAVKLAAWGVALGWLGAFASSRWLGSVLYGVDARDPLTFALVPLLLLAVAALAALPPARRALRIDPSRALRQI